MPSSKKIFIGKKDDNGKLIPDNSLTNPNIKRVGNTSITFPAPRTGDGTYEAKDVTNGRYLFYDGNELISKVFSNLSETEANNGELFFDGNVDGEQITLADGIVTTAKMGDQLKVLSSLAETPDYLGQSALYNGLIYVAISLTGDKWRLTSGVLINQQSYELRNAFTPIEIYKHTRGDSEYSGNDWYSQKGLMVYEQMSERTFRAIKLRSWVTSSAAVTVKIAIVSALPSNGFAIPSSDVIFTKVYSPGDYNTDVNGFMIVDLGQTYKVPDNYYVLVFMVCTSASTLYIARWSTAYGSAPERHEFALSANSTPLTANDWSYSSLPSYGSVPFILLTDTAVRLNAKYDIPVQDVVLPAKIFVAVDRQLVIWWNNLVDNKDKLKRFTFDVTCSKGKNCEDYFAYTPGSGEVGSYAMTIIIRDEYGNIVKTSVTTIEVVSKTAGSGTKNILLIGDSTMAGTGGSSVSIPSEVSALVTADGGITGTFIGKRLSQTIPCEGIPGFRLYDFATNPSDRACWKFTVSGVTTSPVADESEYTNNGSTFRARHVKISAGSGYVVMERVSGSNAPQSSGTLTKSSGTGDSTITFSAIAVASANPFYDVANSRISFQYYCTEFAFSGIDLAVINLGINDLISLSVYSSYTTYINYLKSIVDNINHATYGYPSAKIIINIEPPCGDTSNGMATSYGNAFSIYAYKKNMRNFARELISVFDNGAYNGNVFISAGTLWIDRDAGYPKTTGNRTARDTTQVSTHSNGVHPNDLGYKYLADAIYSAMRKSLS